MKKFNRTQLIYFSLMTLCMILADICIWLSSDIFQIIACLMLLMVVVFAIKFFKETRMKDTNDNKKRPKKHKKK